MKPLRCLDPEAIIPISRSTTEVIKTGAWSEKRPAFQQKVSPCRASCPNGNNIAEALFRASEGDYDGALAAFLEETPLPGVCGRVCYHPCQEPCNRAPLDGAVGIPALEREVSDLGVAQPEALTDAGRGLPVAVIGSGPAGMAAAYHLARMGHPVTLYEARDRLGGLLVGGLPAYRLPEDALRRDLGRILWLGVEVVTNRRVDREGLENLSSTHRAVVLATGAWVPSPLGLPGEELAGVVPGLPFLLEPNAQARARGRRVAVIGGGNTAVDAARTALRRGASKVTLLYRRSREAMPAFEDEVREAEEEGVEVRFLLGPAAFQGANGSVTGVRFQKMRLLEPAGGGRPGVEPVPGGEETVSCDLVLTAVGQSPASGGFAGVLDWEGGLVRVDGWGRTARPGVYAAGDVAPGRAAVVDALASGKKAALAIHQDLTGRADIRNPATLGEGSAFSIRDLFQPRSDYDPTALAHVGELTYLAASPDPPQAAPRLEPALRVAGFDEVVGPLDAEGAASEARRCFFCGICVGCEWCATYCPEGVMGRRAGEAIFRTDPDYCKGCAACAAVCVRGVLTMGDER